MKHRVLVVCCALAAPLSGVLVPGGAAHSAAPELQIAIAVGACKPNSNTTVLASVSNPTDSSGESFSQVWLRSAQVATGLPTGRDDALSNLLDGQTQQVLLNGADGLWSGTWETVAYTDQSYKRELGRVTFLVPEVTLGSGCPPSALPLGDPAAGGIKAVTPKGRLKSLPPGKVRVTMIAKAAESTVPFRVLVSLKGKKLPTIQMGKVPSSSRKVTTIQAKAGAKYVLQGLLSYGKDTTWTNLAKLKVR